MCDENELIDDDAKEVLNFSHVACTDVGLVRSVNEDVYLNSNTLNGQLFVVCDGMGGHSRGRLAAQTAAEQLQAIMNTQFFENVPFGLKTSIIHANQEIANLNHNKIEFKRMGTTVVVALIRNGYLYYAHVGDSRLYLLRKGKFYQLTQDHTYVQQLVDGGIISLTEARTHPQRNHLTQAVGIYYEVKPSTAETPIECQPEDVFLLCTDGITEMLDDKEIQTILEESNSLKETADLLIDISKEKGGEDNLTVMLVRINELEW